MRPQSTALKCWYVLTRKSSPFSTSQNWGSCSYETDLQQSPERKSNPVLLLNRDFTKINVKSGLVFFIGGLPYGCSWNYGKQKPTTAIWGFPKIGLPQVIQVRNDHDDHEAIHPLVTKEDFRHHLYIPIISPYIPPILLIYPHHITIIYNHVYSQPSNIITSPLYHHDISIFASQSQIPSSLMKNHHDLPVYLPVKSH